MNLIKISSFFGGRGKKVIVKVIVNQAIGEIRNPDSTATALYNHIINNIKANMKQIISLNCMFKKIIYTYTNILNNNTTEFKNMIIQYQQTFAFQVSLFSKTL